MNTDTGEIKDYRLLTVDEKASGKWIELRLDQLRRLAEQETRRLARRNAGLTSGQIDARLAKAEAKRARKAAVA